MKALLGTKVGMTNLFDEEGKRYAVTIVYVEPNYVLEVKTKEKNGYIATKVGYETTKEKSLNKPKLSYFKKLNCEPKKFVREFRNVEGYNVGDLIKVDAFNKGDYVDVQAFTKGHGFTGSIKRHNYSVGPLGHGAGYPHRYVGSVCGGRGGSQAQRVFKGKKLPGHYGHELVTIQNQPIIDIDLNNNIMIIFGAIPGPKGSLVKIKSAIKQPKKKFEVKLFSNSSKQNVAQVAEATNNEANAGQESK